MTFPRRSPKLAIILMQTRSMRQGARADEMIE
jgi:hypothetical protein